MRSLLAILKNIMSKLSSIDNKKTEMKLRWTNSSPSSNFNAQTVTVDLSGYDYALIDFVGDQGYSMNYSQIVKIGKKSAVQFITQITALNHSEPPYIFSRAYTVNSDKVVFENAILRITGNASYATNQNGYAKPLHIYGIKLGGVLTNLIRRWCYA